MNMPKEHSKPQDWKTRSFVVHRNQDGTYQVKGSHWQVGYTSLHCASKLEAIRAAKAQVAEEILALHKKDQALGELHRFHYFQANPHEDMLGVDPTPVEPGEPIDRDHIDRDALLALGNAGASTLTDYAKNQNEVLKAREEHWRGMLDRAQQGFDDSLDDGPGEASLMLDAEDYDDGKANPDHEPKL